MKHRFACAKLSGTTPYRIAQLTDALARALKKVLYLKQAAAPANAVEVAIYSVRELERADDRRRLMHSCRDHLWTCKRNL